MTPADDDAPSGLATDRGNAASTAEVRAMFDKIARVYDPMNLVISAFQEPRWRQARGQAGGRQAGRSRPRRRDRDRQGGGRPPRARPAGRERPRDRHLAGDDRRRAAGGSPTGPA